MRTALLTLIMLGLAACDDKLGVYPLDGGIDEAAPDRADADGLDSEADAGDAPLDGAPD
jgi:hypothetical protein